MGDEVHLSPALAARLALQLGATLRHWRRDFPSSFDGVGAPAVSGLVGRAVVGPGLNGVRAALPSGEAIAPGQKGLWGVVRPEGAVVTPAVCALALGTLRRLASIAGAEVQGASVVAEFLAMADGVMESSEPEYAEVRRRLAAISPEAEAMANGLFMVWTSLRDDRAFRRAIDQLLGRWVDPSLLAKVTPSVLRQRAGHEEMSVLGTWCYLFHYCREVFPGTSRFFPAHFAEVAERGLPDLRVASMEELSRLIDWRKGLEAISLPTSPLSVRPRRIRVRLSDAGVRWEIGDPATGIFDPADQDFLSMAFSEFSTFDRPVGSASLDGASFALCALLARANKPAEALSRLDAIGPVLGAALQHADASGCVVAPSGEPYSAATESINFAYEAGADDGTTLIRLQKDGGTFAGTERFVYLGHAAGVYLHPNSATWYSGPPLPGTSAGAVINVTTEVRSRFINDLAFSRFASAKGATLPPGAPQGVEVLPASLMLHADVQSPGVLQVSLSACDPDGQTLARFDGRQWAYDAETIHGRVFNWASIGHGGRHYASLATLQRADGSFEHRLPFKEGTPFFPSGLAAWLRGFPRDTKVTLPKQMAGLQIAPVQAIRVLRAEEEATKSGVDWFNLSSVIETGDPSLTAREISLLAQANGEWVDLPGKGWRRMDLRESEAVKKALAFLGLPGSAPDGRPPPPTRFHVLHISDPLVLQSLDAITRGRIVARLESLRARESIEFGPELRATLRPYQSEGVSYLAWLSANALGGVLADDMGLGKTLQALAWLLLITRDRLQRGDTSPLRALVVCPKSVFGNWVSEAAKFTPAITAGGLTDRGVEHHLTVINYHQLRLNSESLISMEWDVVIMDEAQAIKNPDSATAKAARALSARHRLAMSGTPVENKPLDLWSLMEFAMPGALGSRAQFAQIAASDGAADYIRRRTAPFVLRRTKGQVASDLPPRIEEDIYVELLPKQQEHYDAAFKRAQMMLLGLLSDGKAESSKLNILAELTRLRQICLHSHLPGGAPPAADSIEEHCAKAEAMDDILDPILAEGGKVLVFSQFVSALRLMRAHVEARGVPSLLLTGGTENRADLVREFQSPGGPQVFFVSLKAGGSGLNLTAANYVILLDPWWNPAVEAQAIDRAHRIGQKTTVIAYRLIARGTVEERIRELQRAKQQVADSIVTESDFEAATDLATLKRVFEVSAAGEAG